MNNLPQVKKLKRIVIKEELVSLLGDHKKAVLLNQFIYWTERMKDTDKFIQEENDRREKHGLGEKIELQHGWIYKSAEELSSETMLGLSNTSVGRYLNEIIKMGYLERRNNPTYKWDKTLQYRVDLIKIQDDLQKLGYSLDGYLINRNPKMRNGDSKMLNRSPEMKQQYQRLLTENTTEGNNINKENSNPLPLYDWLNN